ncbi:ABC transporter, ATP-binding protein family member protein [Theileria equi strain WA]|uniref:ABC transporter, ATP-binding protein family member protein n=1 Tax=Theileria equi strain WA TaxID=1537102 RepID=L0AWX5_THEEQ|nr:ABC transporter, ATP-binding protein family member protein [Theileria equi strain WA]AFZ79758.1 ABC transporter, ATP-binding protein family member protein [Theileria equi strain WA]|eukprot:XP_004829424.1 ABC transporter, ATP-binding protein family member protein [Theileria equi strain WA]
MRPFYWPNRNTTFNKSYHLLRLLIVLAVVFLCCGKACSLSSPHFIGRAVEALSKKEKGNAIYNLAMFSLAAFMAICCDEMRNLSYRYVQCIGITDLSLRFYSHLHTLSYQWFAENKSGEIVRSMYRGMDSVREFTQFGVILLVPTVVESVSIVILFMAYFKDIWLSVTVFCGLVIYFVITIVVTNWRTRTREAHAKRDNEIHGLATDGINNFETVKYYTNEDFEVRKFVKAVKVHEKLNWKIMNSLSFINVSQEVIKQGTIFLCLFIGSTYILAGTADIGAIITIQTYLFLLFRPLFILGSIYSTVVKAIVGVQDAIVLFKTQPTVVDLPDAKTLDIHGDEEVPALIEYTNVSFAYNTGALKHDKDAHEIHKRAKERPGKCPIDLTLHSISFKLDKFKSVAIVGPTGSGKTTICRLLCRLYDVTSGSIKINGVPVNEYTQKSLRNNIGVVAQDTILFHDTIRNNIRYAKLDATDDEIYASLKKARLYDRVLEFPDKLDTVVGERGVKLSGGEKQRVSIARCFLKDPPIIILDEATSALDSKTESLIQETITTLTSKKTVLTIAHRLSTIVNADNILVIDKGKILQQGKHNELIEKEGPYKELWNAQLKHKMQNLDL